MELTVLGCGGTWPDAGGATSGYLLRHDGFTLWIDAGTGTLARLQEEIAIADVDAVLISHAHPDHFVDLYPMFYARFYAGQGTSGLPLYSPEGFFEDFSDLVSEESRESLKIAYDVRPLADGAVFEAGPFSIRAAEMAHIGVQALGYRIDGDGSSVAYTGDTGPTEKLIDLARDADVLVSEATWQDQMDLLPFHLSASQAAEHATAAGVDMLMLTHIWPSLDKTVSLEQASAAFDGSLALATEGMKVEIGS